MKTNYKLQLQYFADSESDTGDIEIVDKPTTPTIDLDQFDKGSKPEEDTNDPLVAMQKELEAKERELKEALDKADRNFKAQDKYSRELAEIKRQSATEQEKEQFEKERLEEMEQKVREYELKERKTELKYSLTESLGITSDASDTIVGAIYDDITGQVSVPNLESALREIVTQVREDSYKKGYETRDTEVASNKPRSIGKPENDNVFDQANNEFLKSRGR